MTVGGDRPTRTLLPPGHDDGGLWPLVVLLHGRTATGALQDLYFGVSRQIRDQGFMLALPDGDRDPNGQTYWNATSACCDFFGQQPDHAGFLVALIDELVAHHRADPERVYLLGHSNGGYMALRMACDHADRIAAIGSLAGANRLREEDCQPSRPVSVLLMHGTLDEPVRYDGGTFYPGAEETAARWARYDACAEGPVVVEDALDLDGAVAGAETDTWRWSGCAEGTTVELWKMVDSGHVPGLTPEMRRRQVAWLLEQRRSGSP